jgi:hypothetical protein
MNRRSFIAKSAAALLGFTILPSAGRVWKAVVDQKRLMFDPREYTGEWVWTVYSSSPPFVHHFPLSQEEALKFFKPIDI